MTTAQYVVLLGILLGLSAGFLVLNARGHAELRRLLTPRERR
ncbi:MAG: hypothetical protein JWM62_756 [Frankiales bacterium]|jgi:hypothetical protein|nr:hypothetical protein [Frankiales bacterium]